MKLTAMRFLRRRKDRAMSETPYNQETEQPAEPAPVEPLPDEEPLPETEPPADDEDADE